MNTIKREHRWCLRDQEKKPHVIKNNDQWSDSSSWLTFEEAKELQEAHTDRFTGLGLFFSASEQDSNLLLCGIDIDAKDHNPQTPNPLGPEILDMFRETYAERSPSGSGYHILLYVNKEDFPFEKDDYPFYQKSSTVDLEAYVAGITNRYFTYTGNKLEGHSDTIADQTDQFVSFLKQYMRKSVTVKRHALSYGAKHVYDEPDFDVEKRIELIRKSPRGGAFKALFDEGDISKYNSHSEADFALLCMLVPWLEGNVAAIDKAYRQSALFVDDRMEKWDSPRGSSTWGRNSILSAIERVDDPYYSEDPEYATGDRISPEDIVNMINEVYRDEESKNRVSVLPFACGLGKSTAVSIKIAEVLQSEGTDGLIVVTDSIERMFGYAAPRNERYSTLKEYLDEHIDEISILTSETIQEENERQCSCRVLIMSTQRYFQQLTKEQIIAYTRWEKGKRTLILIDEQPGVLEQRVLTLETVNAVAEALQSLVPYNDETDEQDWCIEQWEEIARTIKDEDRKYHRKSKNDESTDYYFINYNKEHLTEDDERFNRFIRRNSGPLFEQGDIIGTVKAAQQLFTEWGLIERTISGKRANVKFTSLIDHQDKIKDLGAKVIILDGTADLSPEYESDLYDVRTSPACRRRLDHLHLHLVNVPTTRDAIQKADKHKLAETIKDYAWRMNKGKDNRSVVFTYKARNTGEKQLETELETLFNNEASPCNVDHFGAIRGKNVYNDSNFFIQYGLYQFPRSSYMLYAIHSDSELFQSLKEADEAEASNMLKKLEKSFVTGKIRNRLILTDIEQNFFRGSIRMSNSEQEMDYYIFFNIGKYPELINLMQLRYLPLGLSIDCQIDPPKEFRTVTYREGSIPDRLRNYLDKRPAGRFSYADITRDTGLTSDQISDARRRHADIDRMLKKWKQDGNYYIKTTAKYNRTINRLS